ncbi:MAG: hypothetical protein H0W89_02520 [Candidatus Levybacteria bacterium]|nr:hypothetical protein [Candidatus Levybacteria bacterium]
MKRNIQVPDMVKWILGFFVILWLAGFIQIPLLNTQIFNLFGRAFTLHHLLILLLLGYIIRFLPSMLQTVVVILIALWLLSTFVFPALGGIAYIFLIILILYLLFSFI